MKKKLGFMGNFKTDQKSYLLISQINHYYKNIKNYSNTSLVDIAIFGEFNFKTYQDKSFAHFHFQEAWDATDRTLVAFDLTMAEYLTNIISNRPKFFFLDDLEWQRINPKQYEKLNSIYNNKELNIIVRSEDHARIFTQCWNRSIYSIIKNYNLPDFLKLTEVSNVV